MAPMAYHTRGGDKTRLLHKERHQTYMPPRISGMNQVILTTGGRSPQNLGKINRTIKNSARNENNLILEMTN